MSLGSLPIPHVSKKSAFLGLSLAASVVYLGFLGPSLFFHSIEWRESDVLVVGRNLGADSLQRWLTDQGYPTTRLASAKGFRVLEARRAGSGSMDR